MHYVSQNSPAPKCGFALREILLLSLPNPSLRPDQLLRGYPSCENALGKVSPGGRPALQAEQALCNRPQIGYHTTPRIFLVRRSNLFRGGPVLVSTGRGSQADLRAGHDQETVAWGRRTANGRSRDASKLGRRRDPFPRLRPFSLRTSWLLGQEDEARLTALRADRTSDDLDAAEPQQQTTRLE